MEARWDNLKRNHQRTMEILTTMIARLDARNQDRSRTKSQKESQKESRKSQNEPRTVSHLRKDSRGNLGKLAEKMERGKLEKEKRMQNKEVVESDKARKRRTGSDELCTKRRTQSRPGRSRKIRRCINSKSKGSLQTPISSGLLASTRAENSSLKFPSEPTDSHQELINQPQPTMADRHTSGDKEHKDKLSLDLGPAAGAITCFLSHNKIPRYELLNSELETKMMWSFERGSQIDEYLQVKINQSGKSISISRGIYLLRRDTDNPSIKWTMEAQPRFHVDASKLEKLIPFDEADVIVGLNKIDGFRLDDVDQRKKFILEQSHDLTKSVNRFPIVQTGLINEVISLVEAPVTIYGKIEDTFLKLPKQLLIRVRQKHKEMTVIEGSEAGLRMGIHRIMTDATGVERVEFVFSCTKCCLVPVLHHNGQDIRTTDDRKIDTSEQSICSSNGVSFSQECFLSKHTITKLLVWNSSDFGLKWTEKLALGSIIEGKVSMTTLLRGSPKSLTKDDDDCMSYCPLGKEYLAKFHYDRLLSIFEIAVGSAPFMSLWAPISSRSQDSYWKASVINSESVVPSVLLITPSKHMINAKISRSEATETQGFELYPVARAISKWKNEQGMMGEDQYQHEQRHRTNIGAWKIEELMLFLQEAVRRKIHVMNFRILKFERYWEGRGARKKKEKKEKILVVSYRPP
ncbi:unnamed protein product [Cuscuta epithymum]|uniref:glycine--tRNA ligase n=1 Tax=Cuscuta epithymum TaxID=186058 RepID=A0AAV0EIV3_9ASTE|nr:unnamed protein product [Cuscuta epithymum]